jgi:hypothetical protein
MGYLSFAALPHAQKEVDDIVLKHVSHQATRDSSRLPDIVRLRDTVKCPPGLHPLVGLQNLCFEGSDRVGTYFMREEREVQMNAFQLLKD